MVLMFFLLRQMGHSCWCDVVNIASLLAVLWEEETWVSFCITSLQWTQKQHESVEIRLKAKSLLPCNSFAHQTRVLIHHPSTWVSLLFMTPMDGLCCLCNHWWKTGNGSEVVKDRNVMMGLSSSSVVIYNHLSFILLAYSDFGFGHCYVISVTESIGSNCHG